LLDRTDRQILTELQENGRISFVALGQRVGLSPPAVTERVRRLEDVGVITGYRAQVAASKVGLSVLAFIRLRTSRQQYPALITTVQNMPEMLECHHLAGEDSFLLKVAVSSVDRLEDLLQELRDFGTTNTSIVLSSPVEHGILNLTPGVK
jgi:Lrp/AsnC family leucine-responsive transcriptional regulator